MLYILSGLPGTGKTTLAKALAQRFCAVYLRIDMIETALWRSTRAIRPAEDAGYVIGYDVATDNLRHGLSVVADSVNPLDLTRQAWRRSAEDAGARFQDICVICSDPQEHRRRIGTRRPDILGHRLPTWEAVMNRKMDPWTEPSLQIDTAHNPPETCIEDLCILLSQAIQDP